jgi:hypothetical protein
MQQSRDRFGHLRGERLHVRRDGRERWIGQARGGDVVDTDDGQVAGR